MSGYSKGLGALLGGDYEAAEGHFKRCIGVSDHIAEAHFYLAVIGLAREDMTAVMEHLKQHQFSPPVADDFYSTLATVLNVMGPVADMVRAHFRFTLVFTKILDPPYIVPQEDMPILGP